ncbi:MULTISPECIES: CBO0543 family protein [Virgibacillus]
MRSFSNKSNIIASCLIALFSCILGTYLDLFFVGKGLYSFPERLFPEVFQVNILFTIFILPTATVLYVYMIRSFRGLSRIIFIFICSLSAFIMEHIAEHYGLFVHAANWSHLYSFAGYFVYFIAIWTLYSRIKKILK